MNVVFGIDFGTTNSLISLIDDSTSRDEEKRVFTGFDLRPLPSITCYKDDKFMFGQEAKALLEPNSENSSSHIIRSPKRLIGNGPISIVGRQFNPDEIVTEMMTYLKQEAEKHNDYPLNDPISKAIVSIPVNFDGKKRKELRQAILNAGINIVQFVHEPLAALYSYLRNLDEETYQDTFNELYMVFDWGGGTLDLTLCEVSDGRMTQIANAGDNEVGGDFVDEAIMKSVLKEHMERHGIEEDTDINPGKRAKLLEQCELAKIRLSDVDSFLIYVPDYYPGLGDAGDIEINLRVDQLEEITETYVKRGLFIIQQLLDSVQLDQRRIFKCLATGGMTNMPAIRSGLLQIFSSDRIQFASNGDRIISEGCAYIGFDQAKLTLAKPIEIMESRRDFIPIFRAGDVLPTETELIKEELILYCTDPRDGKAKAKIVRPRYAGLTSASDPRDSYGILAVRVDPKLKPFLERVKFTLTIDDNLIVRAEATSSYEQDTVVEEFFDLEFALKLRPNKFSEKKNKTEGKKKFKGPSIQAIQSIGLKSNITRKEGRYDLVSGEYLYEINSRYFDPANTKLHRLPGWSMTFQEMMTYVPCAICRQLHTSCKCSSLTNS